MLYRCGPHRRRDTLRFCLPDNRGGYLHTGSDAYLISGSKLATSGGTLPKLYCGAGPGALAAVRWGMKSISIDREPSYLAMLAQRVSEEQSLNELALAAD